MRNPSLPLLLLLLACEPAPEETNLVDADGDRYAAGVDCDDENAAVHPEAAESCNERDDDCDGLIDEGDATDATLWYGDADGDGWGATDVYASACEAPAGWVSTVGDCDDAASLSYPGTVELCDGLDNDCDGAVDEDDADDAPTWYPDEDGDGDGNPYGASARCEAPAGWVALGLDCDDGDADISSFAQERCDDADRDEDCDGWADDLDPDTEGQAAVWRDVDGDGWGDPAREAVSCDLPEGWADRGEDCDDDDAMRYPGSAEVCADGVDNDCDEQIDEEGAAPPWYSDNDGDGWGDPASALGESCAVLGGASIWPEDCDDADAAVNPDATETWYDGKDADCDGGSEYDADGDGEDAESWGGADCDDGDVSVSPEWVEVCGSGLDEDCDGTADPCTTTTVWSAASPDRSGAALTWVAGGLAVGAPNADGDEPAAGSVTLLGLDGESWVEGTTWTGESGWDRAGAALASPGDMDGDGIDELAIGAPGFEGVGALYVVSADAESGALADVGLRIVGLGAAAGTALAAAGDLDGDGLGDLWVADPEADTVWLVLATNLGDGEDLSLAALELTSATSGSDAGAALAGSFDGDGDGRADVAIGAPLDDGAGAVYLWLDPGSGGGDLSDADARWVGLASGDEAGAVIASLGDLDGDGLDDLAIGAPGSDEMGSDAGSAWILHGGAASGALDGVASLALYGASAGDALGSALAATGDSDGDGLPDLAVGAPGWDGSVSDQGAVWMIAGLTGGSLTLGQAGGWLAPGESGRAGSALAGDGVSGLGSGAPDAAAVSWIGW